MIKTSQPDVLANRTGKARQLPGSIMLLLSVPVVPRALRSGCHSAEEQMFFLCQTAIFDFLGSPGFRKQILLARQMADFRIVRNSFANTLV
jgi:hypothetical protein